jgi:hypothetical protein
VNYALPPPWHGYVPKLFTVLRQGYGVADFRADLVAGLTVAIVALPLAMALAIASGTTPEKGPAHRDHRGFPDLGTGRLAGADRRSDRGLHPGGVQRDREVRLRRPDPVHDCWPADADCRRLGCAWAP